MRKPTTFVFLLSALLVFAVGTLLYSGKKEFSRDAWRASDEWDRHVYVDSLLKSGLLQGKNKQQLIEILGSPSDEEATYISYFLGSRGLIFRDIFVLEIHFAQSGIFSGYKLRPV